MKKNIGFLLLALVFVLVLAGASFLYDGLQDQVQMNGLATQSTTEATIRETQAANESTPETTEAPDYSAPDFTVTDAEGNEHRLSDFEGKPIILNFWASWCGPCKSEMPDFQAAYETYMDEIQFLMVNLTDGSRETVETAKAFIEEQGYTFPVFYDTSINAAMVYGVSSIPVSYFIDAEGNLVAWARGALSAATLQQGIDMLLE